MSSEAIMPVQPDPGNYSRADYRMGARKGRTGMAGKNGQGPASRDTSSQTGENATTLRSGDPRSSPAALLYGGTIRALPEAATDSAPEGSPAPGLPAADTSQAAGRLSADFLQRALQALHGSREAIQSIRSGLDKIQENLFNIRDMTQKLGSHPLTEEEKRTLLQQIRQKLQAIDQTVESTTVDGRPALAGGKVSLKAGAFADDVAELELPGFAVMGQGSLSLAERGEAAQAVPQAAHVDGTPAGTALPAEEFLKTEPTAVAPGRTPLLTGNYMLSLAYEGADSSVKLTDSAGTLRASAYDLNLTGQGQLPVDLGAGLRLSINRAGSLAIQVNDTLAAAPDQNGRRAKVVEIPLFYRQAGDYVLRPNGQGAPLESNSPVEAFTGYHNAVENGIRLVMSSLGKAESLSTHLGALHTALEKTMADNAAASSKEAAAATAGGTPAETVDAKTLLERAGQMIRKAAPDAISVHGRLTRNMVMDLLSH